MEEESIHYVDSTLTVTSDGVYLHDRRYTLDAIDSVQIHTHNTARNRWSSVPATAFVAAVGVYFWYQLSKGHFDPVILARVFVYSLFTVFVVVVAYNVFVLLRESYAPVYVVVLYGTFGYSKIAASVDLARAQRIADVVEAARARKRNADSTASLPESKYQYAPGTEARATTLRYADDYVIVTGSSVTVGDATYSLDKIRSAKCEELTVEPLGKVYRAIFENRFVLLILFFGSIRFVGTTYYLLPLLLWAAIYLGSALVGVLIKRPSIYLLRLKTKSGTTTVHASVHDPYIRHLAYEINTARERKIQAKRRANWKLT